MQQFEITLKNEKEKLYDRFAIFIFLFNAAAILFAFFQTGQTNLQRTFSSISFSSSIVTVIYYLRSARGIRSKYYFLFATFFTSCYWILLGFWWIGLLVFLLAVLYIFSKRTLLVTISHKHIEYPSFPKRCITWTETNNVILKDGLLTIDLKNNKIIQQPIDEKMTTINEQEFNDFCKQQLNPAKA